VPPGAFHNHCIAQAKGGTPMEPVTLAVTVATLLFSEAVKEGGKALGKGVSDLAGQLCQTVRAKFTAAGTAGLLARVEHDPTPKNLAKVQDELATQLAEDDGYAAQVQALVAQLEAAGVVRQVMASDLKVAETLKAQKMSQEAAGGKDVDQRMLTGVEAKHIDLGDAVAFVRLSWHM
jgi:hypothetical protein